MTKYNLKSILNSNALFSGHTLFVLLVAIFANTPSHAQTVSDYSALPETFFVAPDQTPNILLVLDTSGSMFTSIINNRYVGAHDYRSRSYQVRQAIRNLMENNVGKYNVGLMTFGNNGIASWYTRRVRYCNGYPGCPRYRNIKIAAKSLTGRGVLVENMEPLTEIKKNRINAAIATEPRVPTIYGGTYPYASGRSYFPDPGNVFQHGVLTSGGNTPLRGSIQAAERYLLTANLAPDETILGASTVYPTFTAGVLSQCRPNTYVFLITDGLPTMTPKGGVFGDVRSYRREVGKVSAAAASMYAQGIETWVFGYGIPSNAIGYMNTMARGGSGNTRDAFISSTAAQLENDIGDALTAVSASAGSASGVSIVSSSSDTAGSVVQAIYNPTLTDFRKDIAGNIINDASGDPIEVTVSWTSTLRAFFLDSFGYLREDNQSSGVQGKLDDYTIDKAFRLKLENVDSDADGLFDAEELRATRLNITGIGTAAFSENPATSQILVDDLDPIWEASDVLGQQYIPNASVAVRTATGTIYGQRNRPYNLLPSNVNGYRKIYSWLQTDPSSDVFDSGTQLEFVFDSSATPAANTINSSNFSLLDVTTEEEARQIVEYIRGNDYVTTDVSGIAAPVDFRNRTINGETYLLGDIVHSTAVQVDTPDGVFNTQFRDDSYTGFKEAYEFRRRVIYVGGNDGLLHAFNGGFWDGENAQLNLTPDDGAPEVAYELGTELWAYAPMNLLPHLKWLTATSYNTSFHVAYMDGPVQAFDVRAFDEDASHVNGWGTILIAGMRLGGGDYPDVDIDANPATSNSFTTRSAYVIVDVTDPSTEPKIIGEITHADLGFTTGVPTVMKEGDDWYLVFGSGPNDISTATSVGISAPDGTVLNDREAKLFRYKLNEGDRGFAAGTPINIPTTGQVNSYTGDMIAQDWNSDYNDDAVYFGVVEGTELAPSGGLYRYVAADARAAAADVELLVDVNQPVLEKPLLKTSSGKSWVFFGTGRYLTAADVQDTNQNSFYGVIEPRDTYSSVAFSSLLDVTNASVKADTIDANGNVTAIGGNLTPPVDGQTTFNQLKSHILSDPSVNGWKYRFPLGSPSAKNTASAVSFRNTVFYTYLEPPAHDGNQCQGEFGASFINAIDLVTGVANYTPGFAGTFGTDPSGNVGKTKVFGKGASTGLALLVVDDPYGGKNGQSRELRIRGGTDAGEVSNVGAAVAPRRNGRTSWRELEVH